MKVNYELVDYLYKNRIYNKKINFFDTLQVYVFNQLELYDPNKRKIKIIEENNLITLPSSFYGEDERNLDKGLYSAECIGYKYFDYFISREQLNAYTIPMYIKERSYDKDFKHNMEGIKIKKNNLFYVYETPKLDGDAKKGHYLYVDTILKKMFNNCGEIVLNANMNTILNNVKQFDKFFLENKSMELLLGIKEYLETIYIKMLGMERKDTKIKTAKNYYELNCSSLKDDDFLAELKIKKELLDMF